MNLHHFVPRTYRCLHICAPLSRLHLSASPVNVARALSSQPNAQECVRLQYPILLYHLSLAVFMAMPPEGGQSPL